jgi:hypothetical protein
MMTKQTPLSPFAKEVRFYMTALAASAILPLVPAAIEVSHWLDKKPQQRLVEPVPERALPPAASVGAPGGPTL